MRPNQILGINPAFWSHFRHSFIETERSRSIADIQMTFQFGFFDSCAFPAGIILQSIRLGSSPGSSIDTASNSNPIPVFSQMRPCFSCSLDWSWPPVFRLLSRIDFDYYLLSLDRMRFQILEINSGRGESAPPLCSWNAGKADLRSTG